MARRAFFSFHYKNNTRRTLTGSPALGYRPGGEEA